MARASIGRQLTERDRERLFAGGERNMGAKDMSFTRLDKIETILGVLSFMESLLEFNNERHDSLIAQATYVLDPRIQDFVKSFLLAKVKGSTNTDDVFNDKPEPKATERKFVCWKTFLLNWLSLLLFQYDLMMKSVRSWQAQISGEENRLSELTRYIRSAQVVITDFHSKLSKCHENDETTEKELAEFQSNLDIISDCIRQTKERANFEMGDETLHHFYSEPKRVCHALGLEADFLQWLEFDRFPEDTKNHRSLEHWICNILFDRYKYVTQESLEVTSNDKEVLESVGFRTDGTALKTILSRISSQASEIHLDLIDQVQVFVRDEFKYNVVISDRMCCRFPYNSSILNTFFPLPVPHMETYPNEDIGFVEPVDITAINLEHKEQVALR